MSVNYRAAILVHPRTIEGDLHHEPYSLNVQTNDILPDRKTLIMLHGYMGSVDDYDPAFEKLDHIYNLVAIDMRGHGLSQVPEDEEVSWQMQDLAYDIIQAVQGILGTQTPYHLVASSMSTAVAMEMARLDSSNVLSLFLVSPTSKFQIPSWSGLVLNMSRIAQVKLIDSVIEALISVLGRLMGESELVEDGLERFNHIDVSIHKKLVQETLKQWEASTEEVRQPVFILAGLKDRIVPYEDTLTLLSTLDMATLLSFSEGEHHLIRRRTAIVFDILHQWIESPEQILSHSSYGDSDIHLVNDSYHIELVPVSEIEPTQVES